MSVFFGASSRFFFPWQHCGLVVLCSVFSLCHRVFDRASMHLDRGQNLGMQIWPTDLVSRGGF